MGIKITNAKFRNGEPFYPSFVNLTSQTWGGKLDAVLMKIAAILQGAARDYQAQRDKYIKEFGSPDDKGNFSMKGASRENTKEFDALMEEVYGIEIDFPIDAPVKLIKRKKNSITPFQAASLIDIVEIVWPNDDGEDLDKVDE